VRAYAVNFPGLGLRSLRGRIVLVMLVGVVIPLSVAGLWLTGSAARSGEALLRARLDGALDQVVREAGTRAAALRSEMLDIAEDSAVKRVLRSHVDTKDARRSHTTISVAAVGRARNLAASLVSPLVLRSESGNTTWTIANAMNAAGTSVEPPERIVADQRDGIAMMVPVYAGRHSQRIGQLESRVTVESLVPEGADSTGGVGAVLQIVDRSSGASLGAVRFDPALMTRNDFALRGEKWLVRHRTLDEPALTIAAAAPLGAFTVPFESTAKKASIVILTVALVTLTVATLLTRGVTHSLKELAAATDAVAAGDLDRRVSGEGEDEVGRVGRAFNTMTESLRKTLRQLSQREALVAVGEFAASLAHEVRNPLTSIRIDLQRVEERLPAESPLRVQLDRALREVERLDRTVSGALRIARSGSIGSDLVDLRVPLERAIEVATPAFEKSGASLRQIEIGTVPLPVRGDEAALEQLFLNILLNAAEALEHNGQAGVTVRTENGSAQVNIWDAGPGISAEGLAKLFDPFYSTKKEGTGLGLSVARQIVAAHAGSIHVDSAVDSGTTVTVTLSLAARNGATSS
jgi:signal transduction histidine kinase